LRESCASDTASLLLLLLLLLLPLLLLAMVAAAQVVVAHGSAGPLMDIVVPAVHVVHAFADTALTEGGNEVTARTRLMTHA